jgi:MFS superfamily sulfate permease-like transporter
VVYRFGADLFYANTDRFADEVRALVEHAATPVRWFVVDASAITDLDYSAARSLRDLIDDLVRRQVTLVFARVTPFLRADLDRHGITEAVGEKHLFTTLHEALAALNIAKP